MTLFDTLYKRFPKRLKRLTSSRKLLLLDCFLILAAFCYYSFFVNKGLVLYDEGYYVHFAQRLAEGELPYKDLALQYTPGYFYLMAGLYKVFGFQILVGRYLSLTFCLLILASVLFLLRLYKINSVRFHILVGFLIIALGYPLLHIPLVVWSCVFFAVLIQICYLMWLRTQHFRYLLFIGVGLGLILFFKQNLGGYYIIVVNVLLFFSNNKSFIDKIKQLLLVNSAWAIFITLCFLAVFKNIEDFASLQVLFLFSKQFVGTYQFTYPPLSFLLQPLGFFKLLPYYFPIIYLLALIWYAIRNKVSVEKLSFGILALTGFFGTVYPASDLLHVYPFLSLTIVSSLIVFYKHKGLLVIAVLFIALGFYMTFFTKSFRYEDYFLKERTPLSFEKTKGILIDNDNDTFSHLEIVNTFISHHTKKGDYIFVYPFSPMLYFVLDRNNPSGIVQFILLEAPDVVYSEKKVLHDIKQKHVRYIITAGEYKYNKELSRFIQEQKKVLITGPYTVFEIEER